MEAARETGGFGPADTEPGPSERADAQYAKLYRAVLPSFSDELILILARSGLGKYLSPLLNSAGHSRARLNQLLEHGMSNLPQGRKRPDEQLAAYFVVISELRVCHRDLRNFAIECSEYCESEPADKWSRPRHDLKAKFRTLADRIPGARRRCVSQARRPSRGTTSG